jgi:hypothetical protein
MREPKNTPKNSCGISLVTAHSGNGFPGWLVNQIREEYAAETYPEAVPISYGEIRLHDELSRTFVNPLWSLVDYVVRSLDPGDFNSYACLSDPVATYVQCLCGMQGWHLEWRVTDAFGAYVHYRACLPGESHQPHILKKKDFVSDGELRDVVQLEHVLEAFRSFHQGRGLPNCLDWRVIDV